MAKEKINVRKELAEHKLEFGVMEKKPCTAQENEAYNSILQNGGQLPDGIFQYDSVEENKPAEFYTACEADLTEAEIQEYLTYKKLKYIKTIKNCAVFFTAITIVGLVGTFLLLLSMAL